MNYREWIKKEDMYDLFPRDCSMPSNAGEILRFKRYTQLPKQNFSIDMLKAEYGCKANLGFRMANIARITNDSWSINLRTVLGQNLFQKIKTKVKNMFLKKRKELERRIKYLESRIDTLSSLYGNLQSDILELKSASESCDIALKDHKSSIEGLTLICKDQTKYVSRHADNSTFSTDRLKHYGYEYIDSYGDGKELWIYRDKPSKKPAKTKAKKKK